jgi:hypothetical protein
MKNFTKIILLLFLVLKLSKSTTIKTKMNYSLISTIDKNKKDINEIDDIMSLYKNKNNLFQEIKHILKNISYGEELFEEDFDYYNDNSTYNKNYDESLEHRLTPEIIFEFKKKVSGFNLISTKSITKDDTGHFVSILLLVGQNNSIVFSDLLGNHYFTYNLSYEINDIITYKQNDINEFYVVSHNFTEIRKFVLLQGMFYKTNDNKTNSNSTMNNSNYEKNHVIDVETYAEDVTREKIEKFSYKLVDTYRQNIKEQRIKIIEEKDIVFKLNNNTNKSKEYEFIIDINPVVIKGVKSLLVITNKKSIYKLNNQNLEVVSYSKIDSKNITDYSNKLNPVTMTSYYILFNNYDNGFKITKTTNVSSLIGKCQLFPKNSTEKIEFYFFDQKSRTLYILSSIYNIYLVTPMIIQTSHESSQNSCRIIFLCKMSIIVDNKKDIKEYGNFYISLLNKKLMITNNGIDFEVVDLTKIGDVDNENKLQTKPFTFSQFISDKIIFNPLILKNNNKYLFIYKISDYSLILFNFNEKSSKIYTSEPQSFNFKVPIILVAFFVILVWNYLKKKNENNEADEHIDLKESLDKSTKENKVKND